MIKYSKTERVIEAIANSIKGTEFEGNTFIAGGYVRDKLLNRYSDDIDIVVNLINGGQELARFLYEERIATFPVIYKSFGTAKSKINGFDVEFVMSRNESYRKRSRFPSVNFGTLEEDVFRRDFTINSLLLDVCNQKILDITGKGKEDIKNGILRTILDPDSVFVEDPLRILRAVRFSAQLGFELTDNSLVSIKKNHTLLKTLSVERINTEFTKIMTSDNPVKGLELLIDTEMYRSFIPELGEMLNLEQNKYHDRDVWHHTLSVVENTSPDPTLRLSALFHDIGKLRSLKTIDGVNRFFNHENVSSEMAVKIMNRLKYSRKIIAEVKFLISNHMRTKAFGSEAANMSPKAARKFLRDTGDNCDKLLKLIHADNLSHAPEYRYHEQVENIKLKLSSAQKELDKSPLPINGFDLIKELSLKGNEIGKALQIAEDIYIKDTSIKRANLLQELKQKLNISD